MIRFSLYSLWIRGRFPEVQFEYKANHSRNKLPKIARESDVCCIFQRQRFNSQRIHIPIGQIATDTAYKGVLDRLLKRITRVFIQTSARQKIGFCCTITRHTTMRHRLHNF